jgi:hypothetical protein
MELSEYLADLKRIPWFKSVGKPIDEPLHRISDWDEWPGPSSKPTEALHLRQGAFHDELRANTASPEQFDHVWESIQSYVLALASEALSDPLEGDPEDSVSMAGWHAAWTAALIAVFTLTETPVPQEIQQQWHWFQKGHWPCGYVSGDESEELNGLIIY